jgi:hypothetical protein
MGKMDYDKFKSEYSKFCNNFDQTDVFMTSPLPGAMSDDHIVFGESDNVNSPSHYKQGKQEAIEIIEDAIAHAPGTKEAMLQAQVLKYLLRMWHKGKSKEDAEKARWYLTRLIDSL